MIICKLMRANPYTFYYAYCTNPVVVKVIFQLFVVLGSVWTRSRLFFLFCSTEVPTVRTSRVLAERSFRNAYIFHLQFLQSAYCTRYIMHDQSFADFFQRASSFVWRIVVDTTNLKSVEIQGFQARSATYTNYHFYEYETYYFYAGSSSTFQADKKTRLSLSPQTTSP